MIPDSTIAAVATPFGRGGVGVIRVSGALVSKIIEKMVKVVTANKLKPRYAYFTPLLDIQGEVLDEALFLYFPAPNSFTGEDVLEFHCHGGPIVLASVMENILLLGAVNAQPGEFSERAFLNNKMDLTQAEAVADLIDCSSKAAARSALKSLSGEFSKKIDYYSKEIIYLRTYVEAGIDFSDEDIDLIDNKKIVTKLQTLIDAIEGLLSQAEQGVVLQDGVRLALVGKPNVGKSSLLNALAGDDISIVSTIAGTTRDVVREYIHINGIPVHISDTAGLRESRDLIESEGIKRAINEVDHADIVLLISDLQNHESEIYAGNFSDNAGSNPVNPSAEQKIKLENFLPEALTDEANLTKCLLVFNKIDAVNIDAKISDQFEAPAVFISAKEKHGIELLKSLIETKMGRQVFEGQFSARKRHLDIFRNVLLSLREAQHQLFDNESPELFAEEMRQSHYLLGQITGEFTTDDLLGEIFSTFCIGK